MRYVQKPVEIEVVIFDGNNFTECKEFLNGNFDRTLNYPNVITSYGSGTVRVNKGDYLVRYEDGGYNVLSEAAFIFNKFTPVSEDKEAPIEKGVETL